MKKILKASIVYKCPNTNQKIQAELSFRNNNYYLDCMESYDHTYNVNLRIYNCKSCKKEHIIELN